MTNPCSHDDCQCNSCRFRKWQDGMCVCPLMGDDDFAVSDPSNCVHVVPNTPVYDCEDWEPTKETTRETTMTDLIIMVLIFCVAPVVALGGAVWVAKRVVK